MLIIADIIPKELQRIIEFLNEQMTPAEILGLEIKQFIGQENIKTLVPRVIGQTTAADNTKGINKGKETNWTEQTFFEELLTQRGQGEANVVMKIFDWLKPQMTRFWYGAGKRGSMIPVLNFFGTDHYPFLIWTTGSIEIYFQHQKQKPPFNNEQKRIELLNRLNNINSVNIPQDKISARPNIPINSLLDDNEFKKFVETFEWFFYEIKNLTQSK